MQRKFIHIISAFALIACVSTSIFADLSRKEARNVIARIGGFSLDKGAVHVEDVSSLERDGAQVTANIEVVFRLTRHEEGTWKIDEVRAASGQWERIATIAQAAKSRLPASQCNNDDWRVGELTSGRARCLVSSLLGVELPSDAVRVKELSFLDLPLVSQPSAVLVTRLQFNLQLRKAQGRWRVVEIRCGNGPWLNLEGFPEALESIKRAQASDELKAIARALDEFRRDTGSYVASDKESVLIDFLSPRYLPDVIRFDPWHRPYQYWGDRDRFTLLSVGPDGKSDTADDVKLSS